MKSLLFTLLMLAIALSSYSQSSGWPKPYLTTKEDRTALKDTNINRKLEQLKIEQIPNSGMPNAISIQPQALVYLGNNGNGSDIYQSPIDHMPILKNDSSIASNMPVLKMGTDYGKENNNGFHKSYPEFSKPEATYRKNWQNKPFNLPKN